MSGSKNLVSQVVVLLLLNFVFLVESQSCQLREYKYGYVCVCSEAYCDTLEYNEPTDSNRFALISSSKNGLRFHSVEGSFRTDIRIDAAVNADAVVTVDRIKTAQRIVGFGGAFTGSVSHILDMLSEKLQNVIYEAYYSRRTGLAYNLMRISIGGSDFDLAPWAYNEQPKNDLALTNFTKLDERDEKKLDQIGKLMTLTDADVKLIGAAW